MVKETCQDFIKDNPDYEMEIIFAVLDDWMPSEYFSSQFKVIKEMVTECEYTPAVLLTSEDYEEDDEDVYSWT